MQPLPHRKWGKASLEIISEADLKDFFTRSCGGSIFKARLECTKALAGKEHYTRNAKLWGVGGAQLAPTRAME